MKAKYKIKSLPAEDRPREKLLLQGPQAMTNAELLAILLGSGTHSTPVLKICREVLHYAGNDLEQLSLLSIDELCLLPGIGLAKAAIIQAALELGLRNIKRAIILIAKDKAVPPE
jgi:DNA repair protein RadC